MRPEITDRVYRTYMYQTVDRVPDLEFGYWSQTIRRWLKEGMKLELTPAEQNTMFNAKVDRHFGFDEDWHFILPTNWGMYPKFEEQILEKRANSTVIRDVNGCIAERFLVDQDESSIPHFIEFPVKTPEDWAALKQRYRADDPARAWPADLWARAREAVGAGKMIQCWVPGPYGMLRNWLGFENLSLAFYEYPAMIHDMIEHMTELCLHLLRQIPADLPVDLSGWWEDMASRNGPFVGPDLFREFLQPQYRRLQQELRKHGLCLGVVDCDGDPHAIVGNWLEEGVNIMFPLEVAAGVDPYAWRKEFGKELRLRGGIAKQPLVDGGAAIDRELERIKPLLEQGGYIPHLDHLVPPNIPYKHYCQYVEKKRKLIGK